MPKFWNNTDKISVSVEELVPEFWKSQQVLINHICRSKNSPYGVKSLQRGCRNRKLLIDFDTLPCHIQEALARPRKITDHYLITNDKPVSLCRTFGITQIKFR
jgi:hypothetical protein